MNRQRRSSIQKILDQIEFLKCDLEELRDEEEEYMYNIPENLQQSDRYYAAEEAVSNLDNAISNIEEAIMCATEAIE